MSMDFVVYNFLDYFVFHYLFPSLFCSFGSTSFVLTFLPASDTGANFAQPYIPFPH